MKNVLLKTVTFLPSASGWVAVEELQWRSHCGGRAVLEVRLLFIWELASLGEKVREAGGDLFVRYPCFSLESVIQQSKLRETLAQVLAQQA